MKAIIAAQAHPANQPVSYDNISMPVIASFSMMLILGGFLVGLSWRLSKEQSRIDENAKAIGLLKKQQEKVKEEVEKFVTSEVLRSEMIISNSFEITATKIQGSIESLQKDIVNLKEHFTQGLESRNQTIARLCAQTDRNTQSLIEVENKLQQQGIAFHLRTYGNEPPNNPTNY